jgi:hypothetical protein
VAAPSESRCRASIATITDPAVSISFAPVSVATDLSSCGVLDPENLLGGA